jgi:hypothetical protein
MQIKVDLELLNRMHALKHFMRILKSLLFSLSVVRIMSDMLCTAANFVDLPGWRDKAVWQFGRILKRPDFLRGKTPKHTDVLSYTPAIPEQAHYTDHWRYNLPLLFLHRPYIMRVMSASKF